MDVHSQSQNVRQIIRQTFLLALSSMCELDPLSPSTRLRLRRPLPPPVTMTKTFRCLCLLLALHWSLAFQQQCHSRVARRFPQSSFLDRNVQRRTNLSASEHHDHDKESSFPTAVWIFAVIPVLSLGLPLLLQADLILPLFIAKRLYIYLMAGTVVAVASIRGATEDSASLGTRMVDLTRQILPSSQEQETEDIRFQELQVLDQVEGSTQAVGLPLLVVSSLVTSLFFVLLQNTDFGTGDNDPSSIQPLWESVRSILPQLITASNGLVVALFARAELKRAAFLGDNSEVVSLVGALVLSALAYLGSASLVWPIQNLLCMCLAINVSRAIQLPRLGPILLALSGLVVYDVASVGVQLVNLGSATLAQQQGGGGGDAASSVMGAVALSKAGGAVWQPGLFQIQLRGHVSDLLGLGDAVFPSLLSTFCLRYDFDKGDTNYFRASLFGFALGCLACEFAPGINSSGLPALLFIVPLMLAAVLGLALAEGNLSSLWSFDAEADGEEASSEQ